MAAMVMAWSAWSEIRARAGRIEGILRDERRGAYRLTDEQRAAYTSTLSSLYEQAREIEVSVPLRGANIS